MLVVSVVAFKSTGNLDTKVQALAVDVPVHHHDIDGMRGTPRMPEESHLVAQHLYVYDGDLLAAQDKVAKQFETLAARNKKLAAMLAALGNAPNQERVTADGVKKLQAGYVGLLNLSRHAIKASREETVNNVEERDGSRTLYTSSLLKLQKQSARRASRPAQRAR